MTETSPAFTTWLISSLQWKMVLGHLETWYAPLPSHCWWTMFYWLFPVVVIILHTSGRCYFNRKEKCFRKCLKCWTEPRYFKGRREMTVEWVSHTWLGFSVACVCVCVWAVLFSPHPEPTQNTIKNIIVKRSIYFCLVIDLEQLWLKICLSFKKNKILFMILYTPSM